jgi:integrase
LVFNALRILLTYALIRENTRLYALKVKKKAKTHPQGERMKRIAFTKKALEKLSAKKRTDYHDTENKALRLGITVLPSGTKSFFWSKRVNGELIWRTIGAFPDLTIEQARAKAQDYNSKIAEWKASDFAGLNPIKHQKTVLTLGDLYDKYYEALKTTGCSKKRGPASPKSLKNVRNTYECHLKQWKDRKLHQIHSDQVEELHRRVTKDNGPIIANRAAGLLRAMINWAKTDLKWQGTNPAAGIKKNPENKRERFVQPEEMTELMKALQNEQGTDLHDFVLLSLYCGQRKSNLLAMRWEQITVMKNAAGQQEFVWFIPITKNKESHRVPLLAEALAVLDQRKKRLQADLEDGEKLSPWVFPSDSKSGHLLDMKKSWTRLRKELKLDDVRIHDLRRTLGSYMAGANISLPIIGKTLGHKSLAATQIYSRLQLDPVRDAMKLAVSGMTAPNQLEAKSE